MNAPFPLPSTLGDDLARLRDHWQRLKRGEASMPFADDFTPSALPELSDRLMLLDVFEQPLRFRFSMVGGQLMEQYGAPAAGKFLDELEFKNPFEYLLAQGSATFEGRIPTFHSHVAAATQRARAPRSYSRLLLPMWGSQQMLLGAVEWA